MTPACVFTLALYPARRAHLVTAYTYAELLDILCAHYPWNQALAGAWNVWDADQTLFPLRCDLGFIQEVKA